MRRSSVQAALAILVLLAVNIFLVRRLFFVDFTNNMQTNAGSFMAISRMILQHFPRLDWSPWWFSGEPFENTYSPMLPYMDAAFAWVTGASVARAYNFVAGFFYAIGPAILFFSAWRISAKLKTSFFAALLYSLFSPIVLFLDRYRSDMRIWDPWRLRTLVHYGEAPHNVSLAVLPLALFLLYRAATTRRYSWCCAAGIAVAFMVLTNAFAVLELAIGCVCIILALSRKQMGKASVVLAGIAAVTYLWVSPLLTPSLLRTSSYETQFVDGVFTPARLMPAELQIVLAFALLWLATRHMRRGFLRFCLLCAFPFFEIVAFDAMANLPRRRSPIDTAWKWKWRCV